MAAKVTGGMKPRQYRLKNIPADVWMLIKDTQRTMEQQKGKNMTFEAATYELIRLLYKKHMGEKY